MTRLRMLLLIPIIALAACAPLQTAQPPAKYGASPDVELDNERAMSNIRRLMDMPDLILTYSDFSISPNSPSGDLRAAVYTDAQGWMYFVNPSDYRVVEIQPSAIYSSPGPALSDDALRAKARKLAQTYVPGFANMESNLRYEEGRKGDMHFFRWEDRSSPIVHMPPLFQAGLRADGQLITYVNTLGLK